MALVENLTAIRTDLEHAGWTTTLDLERDEASDSECIALRAFIPRALDPEALKARGGSEQSIKERILTADPTSLNPETA